MLYAVLKGFDRDGFWLDIRVTVPNDKWIVPRWHSDGKFYNLDKHDQLTNKILILEYYLRIIFGQLHKSFSYRFLKNNNKIKYMNWIEFFVQLNDTNYDYFEDNYDYAAESK